MEETVTEQERIEAIEDAVNKGMTREKAEAMVSWAENHGASSDASIAREYGQGRYMGD